MHCRNRAEVKIISWRGKWWMPIFNPAPFCEECEKGNFTGVPAKSPVKEETKEEAKEEVT